MLKEVFPGLYTLAQKKDVATHGSCGSILGRDGINIMV